MGISRRSLIGAGAASAILQPWRKAKALVRPSIATTTSVPTISRVLIIGYGQSNMGTQFTSASPSGAPIPNTNVNFYTGPNPPNGQPANTIIHPTQGLIGDSIIVCMNQVNNVTGLPVLSINASVGGSAISGFVPGSSGWTGMVSQLNAVMLTTDYVIMIWDQGEGDAEHAPREYPQDYMDWMFQIQQGLGSIVTFQVVPIAVAGLGTWNTTSPGQPSGGPSPQTWEVIKRAHFFTQIQIPNTYYSHTNIDVVRANADDFHYTAPSIQGCGQRYAQAITTLMGQTSKFGHWEIVNASITSDTVTQVTVNTTEGLGTDFTPTTNEDGWEISGDNGANWTQITTGSRINSTTLSLPHASLGTPTNNARLLRYQFSYNQGGPSAAGPSTGYLRDNSSFPGSGGGVSSIAVPTTPTPQFIRPTGASTILPMPTWRNADSTYTTTTVPLTGAVVNGTTTAQPTRKLLCWPNTALSNYQKFLVFAIYSGFPIDTVHNPMTLTVTPDIGSQVTANFIVQHTTSVSGLIIYTALLNTNSNMAQYLTMEATLASPPFTSYVIHVFDVDASTLTSQTMESSNQASVSYASGTTVPVSNSGTINISSSGSFIIALNHVNQNCQTAGAYATYSSNFNNVWEDGITVTLSAANVASNASSPFTISQTPQNGSTINMDMLLAAWR